jgi:hypothetical protein
MKRDFENVKIAVSFVAKRSFNTACCVLVFNGVVAGRTMEPLGLCFGNSNDLSGRLDNV